jgi:hypothetical protein
LALDLLDFDITVEAVESLLQHVCEIFPTTVLEVACDLFVDKFYEKLLDFLMNKYNTDDACHMMGACTD